jgi:peptidoglycan hydrolase CwlO-like protein
MKYIKSFENKSIEDLKNNIQKLMKQVTFKKDQIKSFENNINKMNIDQLTNFRDKLEKFVNTPVLFT